MPPVRPEHSPGGSANVPRGSIGAGMRMDDERDIIDALAPLLKVRLELQQTCRFGGGGWTAPHLPETGGWAPFHAVTSGACILEVEGQQPVRLETGDIAVLPHGRSHVIRGVNGRDG